jgi:ribosome-associated heat shock protein Hsp15
MRLDLYLGTVCLLKTRSQAARSLERGQVRVNGEIPRASREVHPGDLIELKTNDRELKVRVLLVPEKSVSRKEAHTCYETLLDRRRERWEEEE